MTEGDLQALCRRKRWIYAGDVVRIPLGGIATCDVKTEKIMASENPVGVVEAELKRAKSDLGLS
jgi:hypothetical protein